MLYSQAALKKFLMVIKNFERNKFGFGEKPFCFFTSHLFELMTRQLLIQMCTLVMYSSNIKFNMSC